MISEPCKDAILLIEDHPVVAFATQQLLTKLLGPSTIKVCPTAECGVKELKSDGQWSRIFLDIGVPGAHGLSLARQIEQLGFANICTVVTGAKNSHWVAEVASMGMLGYIVKTMNVDELASALKQVLAGQQVYPAADQDEPAAVRLTRRQQDVLCLLHRGHTSKDIALQLGLTAGTVDNHVCSLLNALGCKSRAQAIARGIELGYLNLDDNCRYISS